METETLEMKGANGIVHIHEDELETSVGEDEDEKKISMFIETKLRNLDYRPYLYQLENIMDSPFMSSHQQGCWLRRVGDSCDKNRDYVEGIDLGDVKHFSIAQMREFTNNFGRGNFICDSFYGRLFKGQISNRNVLIKTMDFYFPLHKYIVHFMARIHDEIVFLRDPLIKSHPNFAKLIGYCVEEKIAFVFDVDPKATVDQLLASDEFGWEARMKVAMDFGRLLKLSHENLIIYGSIDVKNIMMDQNWDTKFFEFGFNQRVSNKNDKIKLVCVPRHIAYIPVELHNDGALAWSMKTDVFAYGILLLNLVSKEMQLEAADDWLVKKLKIGETKSLVSDSFEMDEHTGSRITKLMMSCMAKEPASRPDMDTVIKDLEDLVGHHRKIHAELLQIQNGNGALSQSVCGFE